MALSDTEWTDSNFVAGELCLDFSNTLSGRRQGLLKDRLKNYEALIDWFRMARLLDAAEKLQLTRKVSANSQSAMPTYQRAIGLRECIFTIFDAIRSGEEPKAAAIDTLNRYLSATTALRAVERVDDGFRWGWVAGANPFQKALGRIALSTADLLTSERRLRVKKCSAEGCAWLFVDETKNHGRVWCNMAVCGNRAKARRHATAVRSGRLNAECR